MGQLKGNYVPKRLYSLKEDFTQIYNDDEEEYIQAKRRAEEEWEAWELSLLTQVAQSEAERTRIQGKK